jgi:hypothetical protein
MAGNGISDAVRNSITTWITVEIAEELRKAFPTYLNDSRTLRSQLTINKNWSRKTRRKISTGYERDYICTNIKPIGKINLKVHTDNEDKYIKYVTFYIDKTLICGGFVNVPSMNIKQIEKREITNLKIYNSTFIQFTSEQFKQIETK